MNGSKMVGVLLIGAVVGAAVGVLFASEKGNKAVKGFLGTAEGMMGKMKKRVKAEAKALRMKSEELYARAEDKMDDVTEAVKQKAEALKNHS